MPEYYDKDGNRVEGVQSAEEVAAAVKAKEDEITAKNAEKDQNFDKARQEKEAAEAREAEAKKALEDRNQEIVQADRNKTVDALAKGDTELAEKIKFHLKRLEGEIKTPEDFQKVLGDAYTLAAGQPVPDTLSGVISSAGASNKGGAAKTLPISADALPVAEKLGVSEEDLKTYKDQI